MDRFAFFDATFLNKRKEAQRGKKQQRYLVTILQQDGAAILLPLTAGCGGESGRIYWTCLIVSLH